MRGRLAVRRRTEVGTAQAQAPFSAAPRNGAAVRSAYDAQDVAALSNLAGKTACVRGAAAKVYLASSGRFAAIDFDKDYKKALVAIVMASSIPRLQCLQALSGKSVLVSGKVQMYQGRPQIVIDSTKQIRIIARDRGGAQPETDPMRRRRPFRCPWQTPGASFGAKSRFRKLLLRGPLKGNLTTVRYDTPIEY